jgi:hypothetical protein
MSKEALSSEAVEILRQVQVCILREPELYDQASVPFMSCLMTCDSPCCFSGWVAWVKGGKKLFNYYMDDDGAIGVDALSEMLGITYDMAHELFADWPFRQMRAAWLFPRTLRAAEDGAAYIDQFIAKYRPKE